MKQVFKNKPGGLVVDCLRLPDEPREALATHTGIGGRGQTAIQQIEAVAVMQTKYEVCCDLFHGFDHAALTAGPETAGLTLIPLGNDTSWPRRTASNRRGCSPAWTYTSVYLHGPQAHHIQTM